MAQDSSAAVPKTVAAQDAFAISPAERSRLTQCFQHGTQNAAKNNDYAVEMFATCVLGDPSNTIYLQHLFVALRRKYGSKAGGGLASLWSAGARGSLRKLASAGKWREVIQQGLGIVRSNPGDSMALLMMADASGSLGYRETQRVYLKAALDAAPGDFEVNKQCATFLAIQGDYDQAVACWIRISNMKGRADDAQRMIAKLQVDKTITAGHGLTGRLPPSGAGQKSAEAEGAAPADRRAALEQSIVRNPADIEAYLELADLIERDATIDEAEQLLLKALSASGNDLKVREHVEDRQLRWARHRVHIAEQRLSAEDTPDNRGTVERLRSTQLKHEIDVYSARAARYPENITWKYELAMRLKASGNHAEAIKHFQDVLQDARRKGAVALELGECFQKIRQYPLASRNYQVAVESLTDREMELRKRALYRAGVLAAGLDDVDAARKYLSTLAELDLGYRDVAQRLDKLTPAKDKGSVP